MIKFFYYCVHGNQHGKMYVVGDVLAFRPIMGQKVSIPDTEEIRRYFNCKYGISYDKRYFDCNTAKDVTKEEIKKYLQTKKFMLSFENKLLEDENE